MLWEIMLCEKINVVRIWKGGWENGWENKNVVLENKISICCGKIMLWWKHKIVGGENNMKMWCGKIKWKGCAIIIISCVRNNRNVVKK